ncbi:hypothetical protein KR018_011644, partial [Drosophila ironensis]
RDSSSTIIAVLVVQLLGSGWAFQEKAPVQTSLVTGQARTDKQQQVLDDPLGSGRGIDEHLLKTIGKGGIKLVMAGAPTTTPKPSVQHHYYYPPEDQQHPRQYGYGPYYPSPPPPPPPQQRPWGPPPPPVPAPGPPQAPYYNPYYYGGYGYGGYGGYGYGYPGYGGYSYPYYPYYRNSAASPDVDTQGQTPDTLTPLPVPGVFQARGVLPQNFLEGRNNANIVPLFHLLQMARA